MARIRTYDAPIDRIRPDDRGFAAQETAARRISFKTTEQVQNLREGGRLAAQNIRMQAAFDDEIAALQAGPQTRSGGGGGGGGSGGGGGGSRGSSAAPREAAQMAAATTRAVAGPSWTGMGTNTSKPQWINNPRPSEYGYYDPDLGLPLAMRQSAGIADFTQTRIGADTTYPAGRGNPAVRLDREGYVIPQGGQNPLAPPDPYAYESSANSYPGQSAIDPVMNTAQRLGGYFQEYAGAIASGLSAAYQRATSTATETDTPYDVGY